VQLIGRETEGALRQLLKMTSSFFVAHVRRISFLCVLAGSILIGHGHAGEVAGQSPQLHKRYLLPGLEWINWTGRSNPDIWVLRIDPQRYRFKVMNFRNEGASQPLSLWEWMDRSGALAVFNAGQYYPDFSYMGLLVSGGRKVHGRLHSLFQALFLAEPLEQGVPAARILDLAEEEFDLEKPGYLEIAQSFMLLDRWKNIRVRRSSNAAVRTILAEETEGDLLLLLTQGPYTLWDLAQELREGPFPILKAMSMDGGEEAQLGVRTKDFSYPPTWEAAGRAAPYPRALPTVIGVFSRY